MKPENIRYSIEDVAEIAITEAKKCYDSGNYGGEKRYVLTLWSDGEMTIDDYYDNNFRPFEEHIIICESWKEKELIEHWRDGFDDCNQGEIVLNIENDPDEYDVILCEDWEEMGQYKYEWLSKNFPKAVKKAEAELVEWYIDYCININSDEAIDVDRILRDSQILEFAKEHGFEVSF